MKMDILARGSAAVLAVAAATAVAANHVDASQRVLIGAHHFGGSGKAPAIVFGGQTVIGGPVTKVTISVDGTIQGHDLQPLKDNPVDVRPLLKLAEAENFFTLPANIAGQRQNVDNGPHYIRIYTSTGLKSVTLQATGRSRAFTELYDTLSAVADKG